MTIEIDFQQIQANLPEYLKQVEAGDTVVICKDHKPVAELRPIKKPRPVGLAKGKVIISPDFFDPLPEDILKGFEGTLDETAP